jgi:hypothetical protein
VIRIEVDRDEARVLVDALKLLRLQTADRHDAETATNLADYVDAEAGLSL